MAALRCGRARRFAPPLALPYGLTALYSEGAGGLGACPTACLYSPQALILTLSFSVREAQRVVTVAVVPPDKAAAAPIPAEPRSPRIGAKPRPPTAMPEAAAPAATAAGATATSSFGGGGGKAALRSPIGEPARVPAMAGGSARRGQTVGANFCNPGATEAGASAGGMTTRWIPPGAEEEKPCARTACGTIAKAKTAKTHHLMQPELTKIQPWQPAPSLLTL